MDLTKINTKDKAGISNGWILLIYKQTDEIFRDYQVKFVYASGIAPKTKKGPHMHLKRECRLAPIVGKVKVTLRKNDEYSEVTLDSNQPSLLIVEAGTPFMVENYENEQAVILNLANHIWTNEDQDNHSVNDWTI